MGYTDVGEEEGDARRSLSLEFSPQVKVFTNKYALPDCTPYLFPPREELYKDPLHLLCCHTVLSILTSSHSTVPPFPPLMGSVVAQHRSLPPILVLEDHTGSF